MLTVNGLGVPFVVTDNRTSAGPSEFTRQPTNILLTGPAHLPILPAESDPNGNLTYIAVLTDAHGQPLPFRTVYLSLNNPLFEATGAIFEATTGANGSATFTINPAFVRTTDWHVTAAYYGDWQNQGDEPDDRRRYAVPRPVGRARAPAVIDEYTSWQITGTEAGATTRGRA